MLNEFLIDSLSESCKIHFLGVCGVGMSSLARYFHSLHYTVSGSDSYLSEKSESLRSEGVDVLPELSGLPDNLDIVVYSTAIKPTHPLLREAFERKLPVFHRSEVLGFILNGKVSIGVSGTHGKTTTSSLISFLSSAAGLSPTFFVGGRVMNIGNNFSLGEGDLYIAEVDESDKSHLNISPKIAVITNVELDHSDIYEDVEDIYATFYLFMQRLSASAVVVCPVDDDRLINMAKCEALDVLTFGEDITADFSCSDIRSEGNLKTSFMLSIRGAQFGRICLGVTGRHNVLNALAALAALSAAGYSADLFVDRLDEFKGAGRRSELICEKGKLAVYDDYAHHPTEVSATLSALRDNYKDNRPLVAIFQPHRYTRCRQFMKGFADALSIADQVIVTGIYSAGEDNNHEIDSRMICEFADESLSQKYKYVEKSKIIQELDKRKYVSACVVFLGAGDITYIAHEYANSLKRCIA